MRHANILFIVFALIVALFAACLFLEYPFIKDSRTVRKQRARMVSEITQTPNVKRIAYIMQKKDWEPVFDVYVEMEGGIKIIFRDVRYENDVLVFETLPRIGGFGFLVCSYGIREKRFVDYSYTLYNDYDPYPIARIGESVFDSKSVISILTNYKDILAIITDTYYTAGNSFFDYLNSGKDEEAFAAYDGRIHNNSRGYEIRCVYKIDGVPKGFYNIQTKWLE